MLRDPSIGEILVQADELQHRVRELGAEITRDYAGRDLLLIGVLKGAVFFLADLMREIEAPCEVDFMAVASYGSATESSGVVRILKDLDTPIEGRDVLIVEDIVDSGPDAAVPAAHARRRAGRPRWRSARCSPSPSAAPSTSRPATSASRSPTSSRSATGSTTRSGSATCRTSPRYLSHKCRGHAGARADADPNGDRRRNPCRLAATTHWYSLTS